MLELGEVNCVAKIYNEGTVAALGQDALNDTMFADSNMQAKCVQLAEAFNVAAAPHGAKKVEYLRTALGS